MRCKRPRLGLGFALVLGACLGLLAACSPDAGDNVPSAKALNLGLAETVERLNKPATSKQAVWALLRHLGIGVYRGDGAQVMAGSETDPDDFWLYDFEVRMLARKAQSPKRPFAHFHRRLQQYGYQGTPEQLAERYRDTYAKHPDALFVRLLAQMDIDFQQPPELNALQQWLLMLDTFVPPNGPQRSAANFFISHARAARPCGTIVGGEVLPHWGIMRDARDVSALLAAEEAYATLHSSLLLAGIFGELDTSATEAHEGHGGPGDTLRFEATVEMDYDPQDIPVAGVSCGVLRNLDPSIVGAIADAEVHWVTSDAFNAHGTLDLPAGGTTRTDASGRASIEFRAKPEAANGEGELRSTNATVTAYVDPAQLLRVGAGSVSSRLALALPERVQLGAAEVVTLSWHEKEEEGIPDGVWTGTIASATDIDYRSLHSESVATGPIDFTVAAGEVTGTWQTEGHGTTTMENGHGRFTFTNRGELLGTSTHPRIVGTGAEIRQRITITIDDVNITHRDNRRIPLESDEPRALPVDEISCETVTGRWSFSPYAHVQGDGWFTVTRADDLSEEQRETYREELASLLEQGHALREAVRTRGTLDAARLGAMLQQARDLRSSLERSMECDPELDRYASPLAGVLTDMLDFALDNPGALDDASMSELVRAAASTRALKPEASADAEDMERRARLGEELGDRADEAAEEGDCESLGAIRRANGAVEGGPLNPAIEETWSGTCA